MLETTAFLCGALVMALEMVGARVLAPYVGTSSIVWTSLIGIVLACLAAGSYAGGRYADRHLSRRGLAHALCGAAVGCAIAAFSHPFIGRAVNSHISNLYMGAVFAAICIFALPAFFFGMITPYIIRLRIGTVDTAGATVGRLYALSTTGSILGTFLGGFILISWFSSTTILWGIALAMLIISLMNAPQKPWLRLVLLALFVFLAWQDADYAAWQAEKGGSILVESPYNSIRIMHGSDYSRNNAPVILMATDPGYTQSGMLANDPDEPYFDYTRYYALGPALNPDAKNVLMLGGGGYSIPKWLLAGKSGLANPSDLNISVVELDPAMTGAAKKYFSLPADDPRLEIIHEDARVFLNRNKRLYDLAFVDVFNSYYAVPFQMATMEAMAELKNALAPGGWALMNLISAVEGPDGRLFRSIWQSFKREFQDARVYCIGDPANPGRVQNLMLVGRAGAGSGDFAPLPQKASPGQAEVERMASHIYKKEISEDVPPLRDDFAPVERYALMLNRDRS